MATRVQGSTVTLRLSPRAHNRMNHLGQELKQTRSAVIETLTAGWDMLTEEQQYAAIRGEAATYHDPNGNQEKSARNDDNILSPSTTAGSVCGEEE